MSLVDKLERSFIKPYSSEYKCIILHPKTYTNLVKELEALSNIDMTNCGNLVYRSVPLYRSVDIEENEFIVY